MGRYSNWTMVHETISRAVTSNSVSLKVICTELSKVSFQSQHLIRPNPATLARASDYENVFTSLKMKPQSNRTHIVKCVVGAQGECWYWCQSHFSVTMNMKNLTEKPCDFIGLLLLNLLVIQGFKEDVQDQYIFSGEWTDKSTPQRFLFLVILHDTKWSHISCVTIFHYCYIEGERWRPRSCYAKKHPSINRRKKRKEKRLRSE